MPIRRGRWSRRAFLQAAAVGTLARPVHIRSTRPLHAAPAERVFNHVPGVQALVLSVEMARPEEATLEVAVSPSWQESK
jgi:hypothetical protein